MLCSTFVALYLLIFGVITTIDLYYKAPLYADEINDIITNDMLSIELEPKLVTPNVLPKQGFCICGEFPVFFSKPF